MAKKRQRFHSPPPTAPISTARDTSLAFRLNLGFFFRQLCIFVVLDLLLAGMALCGLILYGENRCADVAALVEERGVPTQDAGLDGGQRLHPSLFWTGSPQATGARFRLAPHPGGDRRRSAAVGLKPLLPDPDAQRDHPLRHHG